MSSQEGTEIMGQPKPSGLTKKGGIWQIDKVIKGYRLCESCETDSLEEAIEFLERRVLSFKKSLNGRPDIIWREAAARYLEEFGYKKSIIDELRHLEQMDPFIGDLLLNQIDDDALKPFIDHRKSLGRRGSTINKALEVVRLIVNLSARKWKLPSKLYWLETSPMISMIPEYDSQKPYPLDWKEQSLLFKELAPHLERMALFDVNTGLRDQELCALEWSWEWQSEYPDLEGRIFIIPGEFRKAELGEEEDRLLVLNDIAKSVVDSQRDVHSRYVFTCELPLRGSTNRDRISRMTNTGWQRAWERSGLPVKGFKRGVHNLRHTFSRRLRAAGVGPETRKALMGHKSGDITTHYSIPEVKELLQAVQKLCKSRKSPELSLIKLKQTA